MSVINSWYSSSTTSAASGYSPYPRRIKFKITETKEEPELIAEEEDNKQKHLPVFDIKDLDI